MKQYRVSQTLEHLSSGVMDFVCSTSTEYGILYLVFFTVYIKCKKTAVSKIRIPKVRHFRIPWLCDPSKLIDRVLLMKEL